MVLLNCNLYCVCWQYTMEVVMSTKAEDVAQYILEKLGAMPAMKLQKLCYYSQAWSLVCMSNVYLIIVLRLGLTAQ